jgi:4-amino-4-deoxy-L-arabinose transferase-like glycosyltransferase
VIFDSALTFFVVLALTSFYLAIDERIADRRRRVDDPTASAVMTCMGEGWSALAWVAIGFGVLTKGPIAILIPLLISLPYAIRYRAWRSVTDPVGIILFAAIVAPWVIAVSLRVPDFLEYALVTETAARFSTSELGRTGPWWYFFAIYPAAVLPWSLVLAGSCRVCLKQLDDHGRLDRRIFFLILWIVLPLFFFTLSQSKRPQYVLPMVPAVALLISGIWNNRTGGFPGAKWGAAGLVLLGLFFTGASQVIPSLVPANPEVANAIPATAIFLGVACLGGGVVAWFAHGRLGLLLTAFSIPVVAIPFSSHRLMRAIGNDRSAAVIAEAISETAGNSVRIVGIGVYPPSLPFYLRRTMIVATDDGAELTSNYLKRNIREYRGFGFPLRKIDWWREALLRCSEPTVFVVSTDDADAKEALSILELLATTDKYAAYGPCGLETLARTEP